MFDKQIYLDVIKFQHMLGGGKINNVNELQCRHALL